MDGWAAPCCPGGVTWVTVGQNKTVGGLVVPLSLAVGSGSLCRLGVGSWSHDVVSDLLLVVCAIAGSCEFCWARGCLGGRMFGEESCVVAVGCRRLFSCSGFGCGNCMLGGEGCVDCCVYLLETMQCVCENCVRRRRVYGLCGF